MQNGHMQNFVPGPKYAFYTYFGPGILWPRDKKSHFLMFCIFWAQSHVLLTSNAIFSNKIGYLTVRGTFYWPNSIFYSGLCKSKWELSGGNTFILPLKTLFAHENYCNWCKTAKFGILSRGQSMPGPKYSGAKVCQGQSVPGPKYARAKVFGGQSMPGPKCAGAEECQGQSVLGLKNTRAKVL